MKYKTTISRYSMIFFSTIFCILLTFCSCEQTGQTSDSSSNTVSKASNDKTIETPGTVVYTGKPTAEFSQGFPQALWSEIYSGPQDLSLDSSLIVLGEIQSSECFVWSDPENPSASPAVYTKNDVLIKKVLKGNASVDDLITVFSDGGIISYEEYYEYVLSPIYDGQLPYDPEQEGKLQRVGALSNAPSLQEGIGEEFILFLYDDTAFEGSYALVADYMSYYYKNIEGGFSRYEPEPDFYPDTNERTSLNQEAAFASESNMEHNPSYSLEEIESLIEGVSGS